MSSLRVERAAFERVTNLAQMEPGRKVATLGTGLKIALEAVSLSLQHFGTRVLHLATGGPVHVCVTATDQHVAAWERCYSAP